MLSLSLRTLICFSIINNSPVFFVGDEAPERIHYLRIFRATAIAPSRARATRQNKLRFLNIADIVFGVA